MRREYLGMHGIYLWSRRRVHIPKVNYNNGNCRFYNRDIYIRAGKFFDLKFMSLRRPTKFASYVRVESSLGYIRFPFFFPLRPPPRENRIKLYLAFAPMLNWFSRRGFREISVNFHYTLFRDIYEVYGRQFPFSFEAARASRCKLSWRIIDVYARLRSCRCDKKLFNS